MSPERTLLTLASRRDIFVGGMELSGEVIVVWGAAALVSNGVLKGRLSDRRGASPARTRRLKSRSD